MASQATRYRGLVSSDWNECLAPCGPFDPLIYAWPELEPKLQRIFRSYTGNEITLGRAAALIREIIPEPLGEEAMDRYLENRFATYTGVPELLAWCRKEGILFLINTTGFIGSFQRALAKGLLPQLQALSAHPFIVYPKAATDPPIVLELRETKDKAANTERILRSFDIPPRKTVILGDSGGDAPHFAWAAAHGALTVGSMTKHSLQSYCEQQGIPIHYRLGPSYGPKEPRDRQAEMEVDFLELSRVIASQVLE